MLDQNFNFADLFVLDLANNHQGSLQHGLAIVDAFGDVVEECDVRAGFKFQFRDIPNFIHVDERKNSKNKHVPRFLSTKLEWGDYEELKNAAKQRGFVTICTPFDEFSVNKICEMNFDVIKVASCSAKDWPLLEKISDSNLPVIASTGGLSINEVDNLVTFFEHRGVDFALMHCVSIYPTPDENCHLMNIGDFKRRYRGRTIGWSTHEAPNETSHVGLAAAVGAEMFERHVGLENKEIKLNAYSSTPAQARDWINAFRKSKKILGSEKRDSISEEEKNSLASLSRGVFAKTNLKAGTELTQANTYFAFPIREGQLPSGQFKKNVKLLQDVAKNSPIYLDALPVMQAEPSQILKASIHEVKALLSYADITLNKDFKTEYSHHYGVRNFPKTGVVLINIIDREYAKKILVQLPGQSHPAHYHKYKEESFIVIWGTLKIFLDGKKYVLEKGDIITVAPGVFHSFNTTSGCVFEEVSSRLYENDSVYRDSRINDLTTSQRKTIVDNWGRFQIDKQLLDIEKL